MEFKTLDLPQSLDILFRTLVKEAGVENCFWFSRGLIGQLARISKENWLSVESLASQEYVLFPLKKEEERMWFWEQALGLKSVTTLIHPTSGANYTFCPLVHPDSGINLGLVALENNGFSMIHIQERLVQAARHISYCIEHAEIRKLSYVDDLTSLFNQRYLPQVLAQEIDRSQRRGQKFSVLFLDIDYFKSVNDGHGHLTGSQLLIEVSELIKTTIRSYDPLFRYGGDEFLALLVDTDKGTGEKVAERIRRAIERHEFNVSGIKLNLTVSIGISVFPDHAKSAQELIQLADQAMYYGKNKSRNIVYIAS